jgi:pimeloyl-ACP methyl ester carboxylesterase
MHPPAQGEAPPDLSRLDPGAFTVRVPTLVIWGERDKALLPVLLENLHQYVPDLRLERIPDGTHWVIHEHPEQVNLLIRSAVA